MESKLGIINLLGIPPIVNGLEKSISSVVSNTLPAPDTWEPLLIIGAYEISKVSPNTGTITLKSTIVTLGLFPGILSPKVLAMDKTDFLSCA